MARAPTDPSVRIERLRAAKKILPRGATINLQELAEACGVTARRISVEVKSDASFPVVSEGSEGKSYVFDARKAFDHLIRKAEGKIEEVRKIAARRNDLIGITTTSDSGGISNSLDLSRLVSVTLTVEDARIKQGERCDVAPVIQLFNDQSRRHINGIMGVSHQIDPTNLLPPDVRGLVDKEMRRLAAALKADDERALVKFAGSVGKPDSVRIGAAR